jgi:hypothetical protein
MNPCMPRSRIANLSWIVLAGLIGTALPGFCADPQTGRAPRRANAHKLVRIAEEASLGAVQALQSGRVDPRDPRYQPLRSALARMQDALSDIEARLMERDPRFFQALRAGTRALAEVRAVLPRVALPDPDAERAIQSLAAAYARLRNRYGGEWLRFRTGKPLSDEEARRFQALQSMQGALASRLLILLGQAQTAGDATTVRELSRLIEQTSSIAKAPPTLEEMLDASVTDDTIEGEYDALRDAHPADEPQWNDADRVVENLRTDPSVGFVFTSDLKTVQQWAYTDVETDLPEDSSPAEVLAATPSPAVTVLEESAEPESLEEMEPETEDAGMLSAPGESDPGESDLSEPDLSEPEPAAAAPSEPAALPAPAVKAPAPPAPAPLATPPPRGFLL